MNDWVKVAAEGEIPRGGLKSAEVNGAFVLVFHLDDGYYAIDDVCTHDGETLSAGEIVDGQIECPRHGARFNIRTGEVTAPPAVEGVHIFPVRVHDGAVQVRDDRW